MSLKQRLINTDAKTGILAKQIPRSAAEDPLKVETIVTVTAENQKAERRTNQSFKKSCDINNILARFYQTGVIEHVAKYAPEYGEVSSLDFEEAFNLVKETKKQFAELPAVIRKNFNNSVENFLAFMENPENRNEEAILATSENRPAVSSSETESTGTDAATASEDGK